MNDTPVIRGRHKAFLLVSIFLFTVSVSANASTETLQSVLAKHLKATIVDPAAQKRHLATEAVYTISAGPLTGTLTEWSAPPKKHREEMALGPVRQIQADDGTTAWEQDSTGNVRIVSGSDLKESRAATFSIESYDPVRGIDRGV